MFCPKCGAKIQGKRYFCGKCGVAISKSIANKGIFFKIKLFILNHKVIIILVVAVILGAAFGGYYIYKNREKIGLTELKVSQTSISSEKTIIKLTTPTNPELFKIGDIHSLAWNGSYWLLGGNNGNLDLKNFEPKLYKYDGNKYTDLTNDFPIKYGELQTLAWNGSYWLLGGTESETVAKLFKYDGKRFNDLSSNVLDKTNNIQCITWNGSYWLIGGSANGCTNCGGSAGCPALYKYDGNNLTDLSNFINTSSFYCTSSINSIAWNGSYWLVGGVGFLLKYDTNNNITKLNLKSSQDQDVAVISSIAWNGSYWLIGGSGSSQVPDGPRLYKYDGQNMTDLILEFPSNNVYSSINSIAWNGSYWLVSGKDETATETKTLLYGYQDDKFIKLK
jgi:hypothetical protein